MAQLLNWMELNQWIVDNPWAVTAACDVIAFLSLVGIAGLLSRGRRARSQEQKNTALPHVEPLSVQLEESLPEAAKPEKAAHREEPKRPPLMRKDVRRALEAIGRWEHDYGTPRGLQERATMVEAKRNTRPQIPAES